MPTDAPSIATFDPRSREYLNDPHVAVQELLRDAPVFFQEALGTYYVLPNELARQVLLDDETFSSHAHKTMPVREDLRDRIPHEYERVGQVIQGGQAINLDAPAHTPQRRALQRTFTHKRVNAAKPDVASLADELIDEVIEQGDCDLMQDVALKLTLRVVARMMDLPRDLLPGFQKWILDVFGILAPIDLKAEDVAASDEQLVGTYERLYGAYVTYTDLLARRQADPGDDLASALLTLTDEDGSLSLTSDEVLGHMVGLTAAGTDTTANLIINMVRFFTEHPDQLQQVLENPDLWDNAVQEGLRRGAVAIQVLRITTRDTELAGVGIPAGAKVAVCLPAANADPARFPDPLRFDIRRDNAAEHLALGRGRHFCLGAALVPHEARIALEALYRRLPGLTADLGQQLGFVPSIAVRGIISQRATWQA